VQDIARNRLQPGKIGADDLDRVGALHAGQPFLDVVLNVLREIEIDADQIAVEFLLQVSHEVGLVVTRRPFVERL
jgi:hypothetical protein